MLINFFATEEDEMQVWALFLAIPGVTIVETASRPDQPLREFVNVEEIKAACASYPHVTLAALPRCVGASPRIETVQFTKEYAAETGHRGRQTLHSAALIGFMRRQYARTDGSLSNSYLSAWDEAGARGRSLLSLDELDAIDWKSFASLFRKVKRQIEKLSPAKLGPAPVLPNAFRKLESKEITLWGWDQAVPISSSRLVIKAA